MSSKGKKIDYLKEDPPLYEQKWVCLSFLTPENVKMESDVRSVKVRGVFSNENEARQRCDEIRKFDTDFNAVSELCKIMYPEIVGPHLIGLSTHKITKEWND